MNVEKLRIFCLNMPGVTEGFPFDETTLVFKVMGKMFALMNLDGQLSMNLKCDPEEAIDLRERYSYVLPGYHMNKALWNTVMIDEMTPEQLLFKWIANSYALVVEKLPKKDREALSRLSNG
ncbi:MAG: MmcQ/YjbR family DNA-binding protein [Bacteroidales bacterium]|nr:MmcQ/YjbR family DNA-binding protein [Bacteroidales bacterium]